MNGKIPEINTRRYLELVQRGVEKGTYKPEEAESMIYFALRDPLTGLYERRSLEDNIQNEIDEMCNKRKSKGLSVLYFDLDGFKPINDKYGHDVGDEAIKQFAKVLRKACRRYADKIHRPHGDEFVVILGNTDENGSSTVLGRINSAFDRRKKALFHYLERHNPEKEELKEDILNLSFSSGIYSITGKEAIKSDAEQLLNGAEGRMREEKQSKGAAR